MGMGTPHGSTATAVRKRASALNSLEVGPTAALPVIAGGEMIYGQDPGDPRHSSAGCSAPGTSHRPCLAYSSIYVHIWGRRVVLLSSETVGEDGICQGGYDPCRHELGFQYAVRSVVYL